MGACAFRVIGELMNNSFGRARKAWEARDLAGYRALAGLEARLGADYLTLYLDGTGTLRVNEPDMLAFLPDLVPAIQAETAVPLSFDNTRPAFHRTALAAYDVTRSPRPILNSVGGARPGFDEMAELAQAYDTSVVVMASEKPAAMGGGPCATAAEIHAAAKHFAGLLVTRAGRRLDQVIVDPGLPPLASDFTGQVLTGLEAMQRIRRDPDLAGIHLVVGLTNVSQGTPKGVRAALERAYATVAVEAGLDFALANPEKDLTPAPADDPALRILREALATGRRVGSESWDDAGTRQTEVLMGLYR